MPDTLKDAIRDDLNAARRDRDKLRTTVLTTLLSEIRNKEIDVGHELADGEVHAVVTSAIKRRREAAELMRSGSREELAWKEEQEAALMQAYLPPQLTEADVRAMVREAVAGGAADLGSAMKALTPKTKGRFDGRELNRIVREEIGG